MRDARRWLALAVLAAAALAPPPAAAHHWWLEPSRYAPAPAETVSFAAFAGMGFRGERKLCSAGRVVREVVIADGAAHDRAPSGVPGTDVFASAAADGLGRSAAAFALETGFAHIVLGPGEFHRYLAEEGLDGPRAPRAALAVRDSATERYARCARVWLRGGRGAATPAGLTLEIVPLAASPEARPFEVLVLLRGRPLASALVKAWRTDLAAPRIPRAADARDSVALAASAWTDARGRVQLDLAGEGEWMVATVWMEPSADTTRAAFQSFWSSLTFARGKP